ncbi:hypothetical protein [Pseudomonas aeruginosa]|uniref:hypothetical protein n=1 Tax=Pseudomonas aeruginosa TaxID=287 RepID=UPI000F537147|nr:hypothetical protein [Pseudomonas aeruginosa]EIU1413932.1 hypothetical protein [Pseudomonas aeruginosa]MCG9956515.1 hypothetical protein [Pseudomonas aeruginosa]MCS7968634.1 hypothetical protein [Pseudomonas aeruginosa]MCS8135133.1 hypothetical protein [Pseudomonas aeruginosa]MCS8177485.1 hypothetical protein [Pseudomonas aeruginosa]
MFLTRAEDETSLRQFLDFNESTWSAVEVQLALPWLYAQVEHQRFGTNEGRNLAFGSAADLCAFLQQPGTRLMGLQLMTPPSEDNPRWQLSQVAEVKGTSVDGLYIYYLANGRVVNSNPIESPSGGVVEYSLLKPLH